MTIIELIKHAYPDTDGDLFVARAMLELYARTDNFDLPRRLRKQYFAELKSPILNFLDMLPELFELRDFALFKDLVDKYTPQLNRDP